MKKLTASILLPAALLLAPLAHAAAPGEKPAAPTPAPVVPGAMQPKIGGGHDGHAGLDGHEGHVHAPTLEQSHEEREKVERANKLTEAKMKGLATLLREQSRGASYRDALAKAKLERAQAEELRFLSDSYYPARLAARRAEKELAALRARVEAAKTAAKQPAREDLSQELVLTRRLQDHGRFRDNFLNKLNESSRGLIGRFEDEFVALLEEREQLGQKREAEARAAALAGFDEERLSRYLVQLQESIKPKPDPKVLENARLDAKQAEGLSLLLSEYYNKKIAAESDEKALAEARTRLKAARAANKPAAFDERLERYHVERLEGFKAFRKEYSSKYGSKLVELLDKRAPEFLDAYRKRHEATAPRDE